MSLPLQHRQEKLSIAYISAVAAMAGYMCQTIEQDYGTDVEIGIIEQNGIERLDTGHRLSVQVKASYDYSISGSDIIYDLKVRNYNLLSMVDRGIPAILVLYCMPRNEGDWVAVDEESTILKHCGYWISLKGNSQSVNTSTVRIRIPKAQMFTESTLNVIMEQIKNGDAL